MKLKKHQYAGILIGSAVFSMGSAAYAEEATAEPQIAICAVGEVIENIGDVETVIDEADVPAVEVDGKDEGEVVIDDKVTDAEVGEGDESPEVEPDVIHCFEPGWVQRGGEDSPEIYYMSSTGGPLADNNGQVTQGKVDSADEESAVTKVVEVKSVSTSIHRAAAKPTAVKSNGRVFLR